MIQKNSPDPHLVRRIVAQEAEAANVDIGSVLGVSREGRVVRARKHAMERIVRETGCSISGLSDVWGCDRVTASFYVGGQEGAAQERAPYDADTIARLRWLYPLKVDSILSGRDPSTNRDIASWRALGGRERAA